MMHSTVVVRQAVSDDAFEMATIHVHAWSRAYRGILPDSYLDGLDVSESHERWSTILSDADGQAQSSGQAAYYVAVVEGVVAGMCAVGAGRDSGFEHFEELRMINVSPSHWNEGIGSALLRAHHSRLAESGAPSYLWVAEKNVRARQFYEGNGWVCSDEFKYDSRFSPALREVRYHYNLSKGCGS